VQLAEKEGLALVNGTDGMLGMLVLAVDDLRRLLRTADVAAAMSVEALLGTDAVFAADLQALRPHPGQAAAAANLRAAARRKRHHGQPPRSHVHAVQDAYSLRCAPQVHGAARDTVDHAAAVASRELAAAIDNPVVTLDQRVESNGNFHGAPVAYVLDFLAIAAADVAGISERRTDRFLDMARSNGLPPFLAGDPGVDSGLMIAQYTAAGSSVSSSGWPRPASVDSIPSSAMQEDHVSMGWHAARKLRRSVDGLTRVVAIELLTAARALTCARRWPPRPQPPPYATPSGSPAYRDPDPTVTWLRRSTSPCRRSTTAHCSQPPKPLSTPPSPDGKEHHGRSPTGPRRPRHHADRAQLADRGARCGCSPTTWIPEVAERPRRPGRLRRHRPRGTRLAQLRRHGPHAHDAARRRDDAGAVRPTRRRDADARVGAAGADRELQPGR
jgi:hypothetical protein